MRIILSIIPLVVLLVSNVDAFLVAPISSTRSKVSVHADLSSLSQETIAAAGAATVVVLGGAGAILFSKKGVSSTTKSKLQSKPKPIDVSIPYDAAARLAYDEWRTDSNKGEFDEVGYTGYKHLYYIKAVADVTSKRITREMASLKNGRAEDV